MITPELSTLYAKHLFHRVSQIHQAMAECIYEHLVIDCGTPHARFLDDTDYPFRLNPWAARLAPLQDFPDSFLVIESGAVKPNLFIYQPIDYWHASHTLDCPEVLRQFQVFTFSNKDKLLKQLPNHSNMAYIGERQGLLDQAAENPQDLLNQLSFQQAVKTEYEIACIEQANQLAAVAHNAVRGLFNQGCDELTMHLGYLQSIKATDNELPYENIIACNQHAAVLHYKQRDKRLINPQSLLIDAGATYNNYCADVSRSYCKEPTNRFADLIRAVEQLQQNLVDTIHPGLEYPSLHLQAVQEIGKLLIEQGILLCNIDEALEKGLVSVFFPHGLGHLLGAQVHDCGGKMINKLGRELAPPEQHPHLRMTRSLEQDQVFTVEPGVYFIQQLYEQACAQGHDRLIDHALFEELAPYGGIRIEDDIRVTATGYENLTRQAFNLVN